VDKNTRVMVVKLLPERHLESFLNGDLHMNSAAFFKKLDGGDVVRSDRHEGLEWARQIKELSIQAENGEWIPVGGIINPLTYHTKESSNFNMFCMYMFTDQQGESFDTRNMDFGDTFVMITNFLEFLQRVKTAAEKLRRNCYHGPVGYVSPQTHDGKMGPFRKFDSFSYQNEFRIILEGGDGNPTTLQIGDIRDIALVGNSAELAEIIERLKRGEQVALTTEMPPRR
jgi:hypothetical protein